MTTPNAHVPMTPSEVHANAIILARFDHGWSREQISRFYCLSLSRVASILDAPLSPQPSLIVRDILAREIFRRKLSEAGIITDALL